MKTIGVVLALCCLAAAAEARYLGQLSANEYDANSTGNPFGAGWSIIGQ